jgi:hypothetical protein
MKKLNNLWLQWFVGFNDAEGNLQVFQKKRVLKSGEISSYSVGCAYHLSLHSRDAALIKDIHQKLDNIGVIYEYKSKPDCRLAVGDRNGLLYLFKTVFESYPLLASGARSALDAFPLRRRGNANNQLMRYSLLKNSVINEVVGSAAKI